MSSPGNLSLKKERKLASVTFKPKSIVKSTSIVTNSRKKTSNLVISMKMSNPISYVKNTRVSYSKFLERKVREVQVQFKDEEPAWIPYETLLAIEELVND
jgi:hypothetical protein